MNEPATETIEWRNSEKPPRQSCYVLMDLPKSEGSILKVIPGMFYKGVGFKSMFGNPYNPTHWAYMPKGPK